MLHTLYVCFIFLFVCYILSFANNIFHNVQIIWNTLVSVAKDVYLNNYSKQHILHRNIFWTVL